MADVRIFNDDNNSYQSFTKNAKVKTPLKVQLKDIGSFAGIILILAWIYTILNSEFTFKTEVIAAGGIIVFLFMVRLISNDQIRKMVKQKSR